MKDKDKRRLRSANKPMERLMGVHVEGDIWFKYGILWILCGGKVMRSDKFFNNQQKG